MRQFLWESQQQFNPEAFIYHTLRNVALGIIKQASHDAWISDDCYCLCKAELDSDGEMAYTTYQLWIAPEKRTLENVYKLRRFLKFYAQKQGYKRWYVISSRLDNIKAYARGLGKHFAVKTVTFTQEL